MAKRARDEDGLSELHSEGEEGGADVPTTKKNCSM